MKKLLLLLPVMISQCAFGMDQTTYNPFIKTEKDNRVYNPSLRDAANSQARENTLFATGFAGIGALGNRMLDQACRTVQGSHVKPIMASTKWLIPGCACAAIAHANSLTVNDETGTKERLYKTIVPFTALGAGYYAAKSITSRAVSKVGAAPLLCAAYAGLSGISLFEIWHQNHLEKPQSHWYSKYLPW